MKIFYVDVETSGLDPRRHDIIELAYIFEVDGEVVEESVQRVAPRSPDSVDPRALEVNNISIDDLMKGVPQSEAYSGLLNMIDKYINKYDRNDKAYIAGYNVLFDRDFLIELFKRHRNKYFGSYFMYRIIDPMWLCHWLAARGDIDLLDYKLTTVCQYFGIPLSEAHTAIADIRATRLLIKRINKCLSWTEPSKLYEG